jgi:probable rRNA maturation factor
VTQVVVTNESGVGCDEQALADLANWLMVQLRLHTECELGITLVDLERMTGLHEDWMNEPGATDVLSFPIDELRSADLDVDPEPGVLGDIVLCPAFLTHQTQQSGRTLDHELAFLVVHGTLHLIGYDHMDEHELTAMFALQDQLLNDWLAR